MYGYPSRYLLKMKVEKFCRHFAGINGWAWGIFMILIMFPTVLFDIIIGNVMGFKVFYVRPLDPPLSKVAVFKVNKLAKILGITKKNGFKQGEGTKSDFFRIIQHYTYDNSTNHQSKFTNYVSLYGFLRTMTLIMNLLFWYLILHFIIIERFDMTFIVLVFLVSIIGYIFFMSFMKFYRRYTVEGFMVLISDKNVK